MNTSVLHKWDLDTPCLILDLDVLEENLAKMQSVVSLAGKNLRPHTKTHKCSVLARMQIEAGAIGVCVAKVTEAEALVKAGFERILVTGPVATRKKIDRLVELVPAAPFMMTVIDSHDAIQLLNSALSKKGLSMDILLDVDVGFHRTGVRPADALELANDIISCPALCLRGIQAYAGHIQHIPSYDDRKTCSHKCLQEAVAVYRELQAVAKTCVIFSSSGTGTFDIDLTVPEVTELQAGSYACMDTEYLNIESAEDVTHFSAFGPALRLLTTVVSRNQKNFVTVDAGLKSLYKDGGVPQVLGSEYSGMTYNWFGDEYGMISFPDNVRVPAIGTVLEVVTSHCDPTVNLFDQFYITRDTEVVDVWPIDLRGCSQ